MAAFVYLLDNQPEQHLLSALGRIAQGICPPSYPRLRDNFVLVDHDAATSIGPHHLLDQGAQKLIVPLSAFHDLSLTLPPDRLLLLLDVANISAVTDKVRANVSGVLLRAPSFDPDLVTSLSHFFSGSTFYVLFTSPSIPTSSNLRQLHALGAVPVLPTSLLTLGPSSSTHLNVAQAFTAPLSSDRPDGLFPTVVSSYAHFGRTLGMVYSSLDSITESIITGNGVYYSRKHGLWRKGETSGATQDVVHIRIDCDADALEFSVVQHGAGFCHLNRTSCFGSLDGLAKLEETLRSRLLSAPEGSYTRRLFRDPQLLRSKIMEEAEELCAAETHDEIAFEAADLLYFALTRCVAAGVSIADIERSLDSKASKVTRRPGNAKAKRLSSSKPDSNSNSGVDSVPPESRSPATAVSDVAEQPIRMRTYDLHTLNGPERASLLRRPVLKFDEMIAKVKPIVEDVRKRGDTALLELTAKFDHAQLSSPIVIAPFAPESMELPETVRKAIDVAYANIRAFHAAQISNDPLVVETMPGVVCSRFSRPIARVGLYIPGGTAVLPSTALMLGIPAQVAGCREIILATPPRQDGSVSPEVMYVARLVGAHAVLKAGGGQAVAALAYGTQSVPKVDKIFGPGNQWVTAAKMLVQNDTDALVSIDMPAGPSEVLVVADRTCNPAFVAADLLSQAEHGVDSQVVLVAVDLADDALAAIETQVDAQARMLSRVNIMKQSIPKSIIVRVASVVEGLAFSNDYAPEHLILHIANAQEAIDMVQNAGSVFVGPYSPESCGDYASGTNHTLPTNGYARQFSGVNTLSFQKHITSQELTREGLQALGPIVSTLADCEGLDAHANAVRIRMKEINAS